ncbi:MAG: fasciclin domain-containing protein, partial [Granulosicoccus sp.]
MTFKKLKRGIMVGVLALCASLSATSAYSQETFTFSRLSVAETLENDKDNRYSIFLEAARVAGLYEFLADDSQVLSIFPPINSAFEALPQDTLDDLLANPDALRQVLLYHVVRERLSDATVCRIARENGGSYAIQTLTGEDMILSCTDDNVILVNGIATARPELRVNSNRALIHPTLGILFPPASG